MKLLIADDNSEFRRVLKSISEEIFTEIIECTDGDEAVEIYKKEKPDWTFMDIKMKRIDGITAAEKIMKHNQEAKIIIISQFNDADIIKASKRTGAKEFVNKEDLTKIEEIIRRHSP